MQPLLLALDSGADQPLRSPMVDKLRLEAASPLTEVECFPGPGSKTPPRSPRSPRSLRPFADKTQ